MDIETNSPIRVLRIYRRLHQVILPRSGPTDYGPKVATVWPVSTVSVRIGSIGGRVSIGH